MEPFIYLLGAHAEYPAEVHHGFPNGKFSVQGDFLRIKETNLFITQFSYHLNKTWLVIYWNAFKKYKIKKIVIIMWCTLRAICTDIIGKDQ